MNTGAGDIEPQTDKRIIMRYLYSDFLFKIFGNIGNDSGVNAVIVPLRAIYSIIKPSIGGFPVLSPRPKRVELAALQPQSQAVVALIMAL